MRASQPDSTADVAQEEQAELEPTHAWLRTHIDVDTADNMVSLARYIPGVSVVTHTSDRAEVGVIMVDNALTGFYERKTKRLSLAYGHFTS